jgi:hypothetical protein
VPSRDETVALTLASCLVLSSCPRPFSAALPPGDAQTRFLFQQVARYPSLPPSVPRQARRHGRRCEFDRRRRSVAQPSDAGEEQFLTYRAPTVRVRPFSEREIGLIAPDKASQPFYGDGSLTATPTHQNLLNAHRSSAAALRRIVRVLDDRVLVFDPPETNPVTSYQRQILGPSAKKVKDIRFCFDRVFEETATQEEVYRGAAGDLVGSVLQGFNATVFAYGARCRIRSNTMYGC